MTFSELITSTFHKEFYFRQSDKANAEKSCGYCTPGCSGSITLHVSGVSVADTDEVGEEGTDNGSLGKNLEDVVFLGNLGIFVGLWVTHSCVDAILLVDPDVVAESPNSNEGGRDDSEHATGEKLSSGGLGILGEENDEEGTSEDQWDQKDEIDNWEIPINIIVKDKEEVHCNEGYSEA